MQQPTQSHYIPVIHAMAELLMFQHIFPASLSRGGRRGGILSVIVLRAEWTALSQILR